MPFNDVADRKKRSILTAALGEHCREHAIDSDSPEYQDVRRLLRALYGKGNHTVEALRTALVAAIQREQ